MTAKELPRVTWKRKEWFIDERLGELRNVKNPHDRVDIDSYRRAVEPEREKKKDRDLSRGR